jgi:RNA:NAD 2'-phosphotransferase (TPT1/KptA family)
VATPLITKIRNVSRARKIAFLALQVDALNAQLDTMQVEKTANHVAIIARLVPLQVFA